MAIKESMEHEDFGDAITGVHSAIKQFVDANKTEQEYPEVDKNGSDKKTTLKKLVKKASK